MTAQPRQIREGGPSTSILLVDDDRSALRELRIFLERCGHTIHIAETGNIAVEVIATHRIDFVLSDIRMPGTNIEDLVAAIRDLSNIPIALMTGQPNASRDFDLATLGIVAILQKPLGLREVRKVIDATLAK